MLKSLTLNDIAFPVTYACSFIYIKSSQLPITSTLKILCKGSSYSLATGTITRDASESQVRLQGQDDPMEAGEEVCWMVAPSRVWEGCLSPSFALTRRHVTNSRLIYCCLADKACNRQDLLTHGGPFAHT